MGAGRNHQTASAAARPPAGLQVSELTVEYDAGNYVIRALDELSLTTADGELVVLLGPSGCGKTTLLSCIAGLLTPTSGRIRFGDIAVSDLRGDELRRYQQDTVGIVFQAFNLVRSLTAKENVMAPLLLTGASQRRAAARALSLLQRVELEDRLGHRPSDLSGGQQQRVAIARALAHDPPLLIADEPTAHLDHIQVEGVLGIIRELATPGRLVLVATHDDRITRLADRVIDLAPSAATLADRVQVRLERGEMLFEQEDRSDFVYLVEQGEIALFRRRPDGREEVVTVAVPGSYFGELGPLLGVPRSASARAITPARLTGYSLPEFTRRFPHRNPHAARRQTASDSEPPPTSSDASQ